MNDVSCVDHLSSVTNVPTVVSDLHVEAKLHQFWGKWAALGASPKVVTVLREGYSLPLPVLAKFGNPHRNLYLVEALHQLMNKNAVELVTNQQSLGFSGSQTKVWRPLLEFSTMKKFL